MGKLEALAVNLFSVLSLVNTLKTVLTILSTVLMCQISTSCSQRCFYYAILSKSEANTQLPGSQTFQR